MVWKTMAEWRASGPPNGDEMLLLLADGSRVVGKHDGMKRAVGERDRPGIGDDETGGAIRREFGPGHGNHLQGYVDTAELVSHAGEGQGHLARSASRIQQDAPPRQETELDHALVAGRQALRGHVAGCVVTRRNARKIGGRAEGRCLSHCP